MIVFRTDNQILSEFLEEAMGFSQDENPVVVQEKLHAAIDKTLRELIDWHGESDQQIGKEYYASL